MKIEEEKRGNSPSNPIAAVLDIERRNQKNRNNFTPAQHALAQKLSVMVAAAFNCKTYPPNFREKMIVVKAENKFRQTDAYPALEAFCDANNIVLRTSNGRSEALFTIS